MTDKLDAIPGSAGRKIIDGLKDAVAGNFASVTIEGQRWVRDPAPAASQPVSNDEIIAALRPLATINVAEGAKRTHFVFPRISVDAVKSARRILDVLPSSAEESAPVFKATQNTAESDPVATPGCAGADTRFPNWPDLKGSEFSEFTLPPSAATSETARLLGMTDDELKRETAMAAFMSQPFPVASTAETSVWIAFAGNGNIRFWTDDPARAESEKARGMDFRGFTLAELVSLAARSVTDEMIDNALAADTSLIQGFSYPNRSAIIDYRTDYGLGVELWTAPATTRPEIDSAKMNAELERVKMKVVLSAAMLPRHDRLPPQRITDSGSEQPVGNTDVDGLRNLLDEVKARGSDAQ